MVSFGLLRRVALIYFIQFFCVLSAESICELTLRPDLGFSVGIRVSEIMVNINMS
jgi:hypothetical protein